MKKALQSLYLRTMRLLPRALRLRVDYLRRTGRWPSVRQPRLYTEKLLWRSLHDDAAELRPTCDKAWGKDLARRLLATEMLAVQVPDTYWFGSAADLVDAAQDVPTPWVAKPNHLGGGIVLVADDPASPRALEDLVRRSANAEADFQAFAGRLWQEARPAFLVEERVGETGAVLTDYKVHVFAGVPRLVSVYSGRFSSLADDHYWLDGPDGPPAELRALVSERSLDTLIGAAATIARPYDYMRVDFYCHDDVVYFSELTPYPSFAEADKSRSLDERLGRYWSTPAPSPRGRNQP